ncbi:MAG TPA: TonB-dependent receptor, partial [Leptospiraceae bacterium]|nr:TonB-dependent receptor [Leptospiraceae bacterium]
MKWRALLVFFLLFPATVFAIDVKIKIEDKKAGKPVSDAQVIVMETKEKFFSDETGEAIIRIPAKGFYTIRVISPSGEIVQPRVEVISPNQTVTIFLGIEEEKPIPTNTPQKVTAEEGISVTGKRERQKVSRYQVRIDEVKRIPGQFGEALRGLETLPGVNAPPFGNGDIAVRGANTNSNTYLLDDLPIGYAFHFAGLNSVIHNDLVKSIDLFTGAYPVTYGNATGGVVAIDTIDEVERFGGHATFSLWSAQALFKGKIGDGYWIGSGRMSYLDITLRPYIPEGTQFIPRYWDGQFKAMQRLSQTQKLYVYALGAKDTFIAKIDNKPSWDPTAEFDPRFVGAQIALDQAFHTEAIKHVWNPGTRINNELTLYYHNNIQYIDGQLGLLRPKQKRESGWGAFKNEFDWEIYKEHLFLDVGLEARRYEYQNNGQATYLVNPNNPSPDPYKSVNPDFVNLPVHDSQMTSYNTGYTMLTLKAWGFEAKPGVRVDYFGLTKQRVADPRGTLSYTAPWKMTISAGGGVYHRLPDAETYSRSSGNPNLKMERAEHYGGGIEQIIESWTLKAEAYRHYFTDIVVADPYITTPVRLNQDPFNRYTTPYIFNAPLNFSNDGTGFSEGWELYIKKSKPDNKNGLYGWISYTWSRTLRNNHQHIITDDEKRQIYSADEARIIHEYDNTKDHYADFDRTHIANLVVGWKMSREWQIGARWKYMTSETFTPIIADDKGRQIQNGRYVFNPTYSQNLNSGRLKPYHRLDVRIDHFINYSWGFGNIFVEMLNVYLRDNPVNMSWNQARPISRTN